ncbi:MAG: hypothetical protein D6721_09760 [Gammaproteobacteria bacterium]|nr:MAG: hypothetical protein D6721_09760 [Gammaproteobacteria bacterium]
MHAILWLFTRLLAIALFRAGPQDLPASRSLVPLTLALYLLVDFLQARYLAGWVRRGVVVGLDALLLGAFVQSLLLWKRKIARLRQTLGALYGTGAVVGLAGLPLVDRMWDAEAAGRGGFGMSLLVLAYMAWAILVVAHVLRQALECRFDSAVGASIFLFLFTQLILALLVEKAGG